MVELIATPAKYVFADIVGFTSGRTAETQVELIKRLNDIVKSSISEANAAEPICLPTGDGVCVGWIGETEFDLHITQALSILGGVAEVNDAESDDRLLFEIRVGINENVDARVVDINGRENLAGAGINLAQRVMSCGDARHLMVGERVFDVLRYRDKYADKFRRFNTVIKHRQELSVYQYLADSKGLSVVLPSEFVRLTRLPNKMDAYYLAYCLRMEPIFRTDAEICSNPHSVEPAAVLFAHHLALDAWNAAENADGFHVKDPQVYGRGELPLEEAYRHYSSIVWDVAYTAAAEVKKKYEHLEPYFAEVAYDHCYHYVNEKGRGFLKAQHSDVLAGVLDEAG